MKFQSAFHNYSSHFRCGSDVWFSPLSGPIPLFTSIAVVLIHHSEPLLRVAENVDARHQHSRRVPHPASRQQSKEIDSCTPMR